VFVTRSNSGRLASVTSVDSWTSSWARSRRALTSANWMTLLVAVMACSLWYHGTPRCLLPTLLPPAGLKLPDFSRYHRTRQLQLFCMKGIEFRDHIFVTRRLKFNFTATKLRSVN